jgi:hypothetical protein
MIELSQIVGVGDVKIKHRHHARVDTVEKHVVGIGCSRVDFFQLVHTREAGWSEILVKIRVSGCIWKTWISQTTEWCGVIEAVSTEVAHAASPGSTESSSGMVSVIGSAGEVTVALSNSAAGGSSVT